MSVSVSASAQTMDRRLKRSRCGRRKRRHPLVASKRPQAGAMWLRPSQVVIINVCARLILALTM
jgi:hypothetical protein